MFMGWLPFLKKKPDKSRFTPAYEEYLSHFEGKNNTRIPIREQTFIVLDTETTGLDIHSDHILSIAAIPVVNFEMDLTQRFEALLNQEDYVPKLDSIAVHGITGKALEQGRAKTTVLEDFLAFVKDYIIIGHHIGFDVAMLNKALKEYVGGSLKNKVLDTSTLANRLKNPLFNKTQEKGQPLDKLCAEYNIPLGARHTASGDAFITGILFMKLLAGLEKRGITTVKVLLKR